MNGSKAANLRKVLPQGGLSTANIEDEDRIDSHENPFYFVKSEFLFLFFRMFIIKIPDVACGTPRLADIGYTEVQQNRVRGGPFRKLADQVSGVAR